MLKAWSILNRMTLWCFLFILVPVTMAEEEKPEYIGVGKCKKCHAKVKLGGVEHLKWEKMPHAQAYKTLFTEKAIEIAAEAGVVEPASSEQCLKCHITTLTFTTPAQRAEGVGCERCHGAGPLYKSKKVMKDYEASIAAGMRRIKGKTPEETFKNAEKLCRDCHGLEHKQENPAARAFVFAEYWAKLKHDEETLRKEFPEAFE